MPARSKARRRALEVLFEADLREVDAAQVLDERRADGDPPIPPYAVTLVEGVRAHRSEIDSIIAEHAVGWTLERMPVVDRNVLRLAVYELLWADDVPPGVVLAEAVKLARELSTAESAPFVNGVLAAVRDTRAATASPPLDAPRD